MVDIPKNVVTDTDIWEWHKLKEELSRIKTAEMLLRQKIFKGLFKLEEGTGYFPLEQEFRLKAVARLDRTVDIATFDALRKTFRENNISDDALVKYKPELVVSEYRKLTEEQRQLVDQALTIKPGAPSLELVFPKEKE